MSQYGEHTYILEYFAGHIGRFLDVGAFDGVTFSNTRPLAEAGWSGVCVEPSPQAFCALMLAYEGNESVELVNAGVCVEPGLQRFFANTENAVSLDMLSSFSGEHVEKCKAYPFRKMWSAAIIWQDITDRFCCFQGGFDFVNIDVEGTNVQLLEAFPFEIVHPSLICIEMDPAHQVAWMSAHLSANGLSEQRIIGGNLLAARPR